MSFLAPLFFVGSGRDRRSDPRPSDPARAQGHRRVPVADVHPQDSVPVGRAAPASTTGRCCCCAPRRWRSSSPAFSRPFFTRRSGAGARRRCSGAREVVILLDRSASMGYGDHWKRAQDEARKVVAGLSGADQRDARAVRHAASRSACARRPTGTSSKPRSREAKVTSRGHALRAGAAPGAEPAQPIDAAAEAGGADQRLPADRMGTSGRDSAARGRGVEHGVGGGARDFSSLSVTSVAFQRATFSGEERVTVTAGLTNRGAQDVKALPVQLEVDGRLHRHAAGDHRTECVRHR